MARLDDPRRLAMIQDLGLLDGAEDEVLDAVTRLAGRLLGVPVSLVSIVTAEVQHFTSQLGMTPPWDVSTPLSHSFCQIVVREEEPLRVVDSRGDDRVRDNGAIDDLGVVAYYGVPLRGPWGQVLGSFCAIDGAPREWTEDDLEVLRDLAGMVERVLVARHATRNLQATLERHEQLQAMMIHDIRQPLSSARMAAETLENRIDQISPEARDEITSSLTRQVIRVDELLGELAEGPSPVTQAVDLARVAEDLRRTLAAAAAGSVTIDVPADTVLWGVRGDVERIVSNLVRNAFVHGGRGVRVTVRARREDEGVCITVEDDGVGIPEDELEGIFSYRTQGRGSGSGQGLGLHIVRRLARKHGGDVSVTSAPGAGTTFEVRLEDHAHEVADA